MRKCGRPMELVAKMVRGPGDYTALEAPGEGRRRRTHQRQRRGPQVECKATCSASRSARTEAWWRRETAAQAHAVVGVDGREAA